MATLVQRFSQSASFCSGALASSRMSNLSRSKYTSVRTCSLLRSATDLREKISSSLGARGGAGGGAGGGGGGDGGGVGVTAVGGGVGAGACGGGVLWQPAAASDTLRTHTERKSSRRIIRSTLGAGAYKVQLVVSIKGPVVS